MILATTRNHKDQKISLKLFEHILIGVLFAGFLSLFLDFQIKTFVVLRPFDFTVLLAGGLLFLLNTISGRFHITHGLLLIIVFFVWEAGTALKVSQQSLIREGLQAATLILFAATVSLYYRSFDWSRLLRIFALFGAALIAFMVSWHLAEGKYFGWKDFDAGKAMFTYFIPAVFAWRLTSRKGSQIADYVFIVIYTVILFLSGERKAQIVFVVSLCMVACTTYFKKTHLAAVVLAALVAIPIIAASNPYLSRQMGFFIAEDSTKGYTLSQYAQPAPNASPSNVQRHFVNHIAPEIIKHHPFSGIGTNGYVIYVNAKYGGYLPPYMYLTIHDEFMRIAVENGLFGLALYGLSWLRSLAWIGLHFRKIPLRLIVTYGMIFVALFCECFFEGSGSRAFIAFIIVSLLPEFYTVALRRSRRRRRNSNAEQQEVASDQPADGRSATRRSRRSKSRTGFSWHKLFSSRSTRHSTSKSRPQSERALEKH